MRRSSRRKSPALMTRTRDGAVVFTVAVRKADHPITRGMPAEFVHSNDELYQNSLMLPGSIVLATAFSDKKIDPKGSTPPKGG